VATTLQFADESTFLNPWDAQRVQNMARFFFASFWCIVFTGAVRKWIFPHNPLLYLLQDVPISLSYLYALRSGLFSRAYLLMSIVLLSLALTLQGLAQVIIIAHSIFVALVGLHHYLFYWPMLLIFPLCLTERYRRDFIRMNVWVSLPMSLLVLAQAVSPRNAWVNRTSEGDAFGLPGVDVARVSGTFNFVVFFAIWVTTVLALCLGEWLLRKERRVIQNRLLLTASTFACTVSILISGSRQTIYLAAIVLIGALMAAIILGSTRAVIAIMGVFLLVPLAGGLTYVVSPVEFDTVRERLLGERGAQDQHERLINTFTDFITLPKFTLVGAGIGLGVDASHVGNVNSYNFTYELSEGDVARNVMELGTPVGLSYIAFRFFFLAGMIFVAMGIVRSGSSPHVLPLACMLFAQGWADMTRAATMTSTQVMIGYSFIMGVQMYPDLYTLETPPSDFSMRSA
jgi:hypothetical protein